MELFKSGLKVLGGGGEQKSGGGNADKGAETVWNFRIFDSFSYNCIKSKI